MKKLNEGSDDLEIDLSIDQLHFNEAGFLKYCPKLLSPFKNFNFEKPNTESFKDLNMRIVRYLICVDRILEKFLLEESVFSGCLLPKIQHYIRLIKNKVMADSNQDQRQLTNYLVQFIEKLKRVLGSILNG